jgi:hypothetical protein
VRIERRKATHPLRPGRRRLARDGRRGEAALGIALGAVLEGPKQAAPAKVPLDAPDGTLEHIAHLAGPQMPEPLPAKLGALLVPGAIEQDHVQMRVEPQRGLVTYASPPLHAPS